MSLGRIITLNNGEKMPQIGLGTWQSAPGEVAKAVQKALEVGYRHIDCAVIYGNQTEVADGIKASGVPRSEIWLTSKLWCNSHRPELVEADLDNTLKELNTDYLDLYEIHWPVAMKPGKTLSATTEDGSETIIDTEAPGVAETWRKMVELSKTGKVKSIGVSNFTIPLLEKIIDATGVVPAVNQIESHPSLQQPELEAFAKKHNIHLTAYSPLGNNVTGFTRVIDDPKVLAIAKRDKKDPAQVLIAWGAHKGFSVIPKSVTASRIESNFQDYTLTEEEFEEISKVGRENPIRYNTPYLYKPRWNIDVFNSPEEKDAARKAW